jgi:hypothetical protein
MRTTPAARAVDKIAPLADEADDLVAFWQASTEALASTEWLAYEYHDTSAV